MGNATRVPRRLNVTYRDLALIMRLLVLICVVVEADRQNAIKAWMRHSEEIRGRSLGDGYHGVSS